MAKKKVAKKKTSPEKLNDPVGEFSLDELREFRTKCENLTRDIHKRAAKMADAKAAAKIATEEYNTATEELRQYISGFREIPLLDNAAPGESLE